MRIKALRPLVLLEAGDVFHMVPKGACGTLLGCARSTTAVNAFVVRWDFHAVGPTEPQTEGELSGYMILKGWPVQVPADAIEIVSENAENGRRRFEY